MAPDPVQPADARGELERPRQLGPVERDRAWSRPPARRAAHGAQLRARHPRLGRAARTPGAGPCGAPRQGVAARPGGLARRAVQPRPPQHDGPDAPEHRIRPVPQGRPGPGQTAGRAQPAIAAAAPDTGLSRRVQRRLCLRLRARRPAHRAGRGQHQQPANERRQCRRADGRQCRHRPRNAEPARGGGARDRCDDRIAGGHGHQSDARTGQFPGPDVSARPADRGRHQGVSHRRQLGRPAGRARAAPRPPGPPGPPGARPPPGPAAAPPPPVAPPAPLTATPAPPAATSAPPVPPRQPERPHEAAGPGAVPAVSAARPPEGAHTAAEGEGTPANAARPPEGAHTVAEGEGTPASAARPPEGAHTAAEGEGIPVSAAGRRTLLQRWRGAWRRWSLWTALVLLVCAMLAILVWLAGRYEASQVQSQLEHDAAAAVSDIRTALTRNLQSLQALTAGNPGPLAWEVQASDLLRQRRELVRIEWRDAELRLRTHVQSPYRPTAWDQRLRDSGQPHLGLTSPNHPRPLGPPAFLGSFLPPHGEGLGSEIMELCLPLGAGGRSTGFLLATYALHGMLANLVEHHLTRSQDISFAETD